MTGIAREAKDTFSNVFSRFGGRVELSGLNAEEVARIKELRQWWGAALENSREQSYPRLPCGNVQFDFIENESFNALATVSDGREFIGIMKGTVNQIYSQCLLVLADDIVFQRLVERFDLGMLRRENQEQLRTRYVLSLNIAWIATNFIFYHELSHIAHCHLQLLQEHDPTLAALEEIPLAPLTPDTARLRRTLEIDADAGAVRSAAINWTTLVEKGAFPALGAIHPHCVFGMSLAVLFHMLEEKSGASSALSTHPRADARFFHASNVAMSTSHLFHPLDEEQLMEGLGIVGAWWQSQNRATGIMIRAGDVITDELNGYRRELRTIAEHLTRLQEARAVSMKSI